LVSQFIQPHMSRSLWSFLSSWWAFTHLSRCRRVDSFIVLMITVTISMSWLYRHRQDCLCWVWFTHEITARLSMHFTHLLLDLIWWNFIKWNSSRFGAAIPNNSACVELRTEGTPSTGPAPRIRTFWFPMSNHPKESSFLPKVKRPICSNLQGLVIFQTIHQHIFAARDEFDVHQ
jgi:hypothetical protein